MPNYALIKNNVVANVVVAVAPPVIVGYTVVALTEGQTVGTGDSYNAGVFTPYVPTAAEQERRAGPGQLQIILPLLAAWGQDAKSAAEITAMTAAERIQRQAVIEDREATLARVCRAIIKQVTDL